MRPTIREVHATHQSARSMRPVSQSGRMSRSRRKPQCPAASIPSCGHWRAPSRRCPGSTHRRARGNAPPVLTWRTVHPDGVKWGSVSSAEGVPGRPEGGWSWLDIVGFGDTKLIASIGARLGWGPPPRLGGRSAHRPARQIGTLRGPRDVHMCHSASESSRDGIQTALVFGPDRVVTPRPQESCLLDPVLRRLRQPRSIMRRIGAAGLVHALLTR